MLLWSVDSGEERALWWLVEETEEREAEDEGVWWAVRETGGAAGRVGGCDELTWGSLRSILQVFPDHSSLTTPDHRQGVQANTQPHTTERWGQLL